jgi:hypothetical protein
MRILSSFGLLVVATAVSGLVACGGSVESTGTGDDTGSGSGSGSQTSSGSKSGSTTATSPAPSGSGCTYPKVYNDPECPPAYTRQPPPSCTTIGLKCWYPGVGDGDGHGCWSTALLACQANADVDGGTDGGATTGHWIGAQ